MLTLLLLATVLRHEGGIISIKLSQGCSCSLTHSTVHIYGCMVCHDCSNVPHWWSVVCLVGHCAFGLIAQQARKQQCFIGGVSAAQATLSINLQCMSCLWTLHDMLLALNKSAIYVIARPRNHPCGLLKSRCVNHESLHCSTHPRMQAGVSE